MIAHAVQELRLRAGDAAQPLHPPHLRLGQRKHPGMLDAVAMIGVGIALYIIFAVAG